MRRAVAFWSKIVDSESFASQFEQVAEAYFDQLEAGPGGEEIAPLAVPTRHVDGSTKLSSRRAAIRWLKENPPEGQRSDEHTSAHQTLMRISYAVFCLQTKTSH